MATGLGEDRVRALLCITLQDTFLMAHRVKCEDNTISIYSHNSKDPKTTEETEEII